MMQFDNEAPPPHHITMIIGGGGKGAALDLLFGFSLVLQLTNFVGKSRDLKSITFLQPSEYEQRPQLLVLSILVCEIHIICDFLVFRTSY
jgi:hypothetical protein